MLNLVSLERAFNAIFSKTGSCASEPVIFSLLRSKCMPILLCAVEACPLLAPQIQSVEFTLTRIFMKIFRKGSPKTVSECRLISAFFLLNMRYLFALLSFCRSLLRLKIVYVHCLLVTRASSYMAYSCNPGKIFKLHVSCAMPFIAIFLIINVWVIASVYSSYIVFS